MPIVYLRPLSEIDAANIIVTGVLFDVDEGITGVTPDGNLETSDTGDVTGLGVIWSLQNLPAGAISINSYTLRVRAQTGGGWSDDNIRYTWTLDGANVGLISDPEWNFELDDGAALANRVGIGNGSPSVADINAAQIRFFQRVYTRVKGDDGAFHAWDAFELEVDYVAGQDILLGQASEADDAGFIIKIPGATGISTGQATETDLAQAIAVDTAISVVVGQAFETDSAQAVTVSQGGALIATGQALESDLAQAITPLPGVVPISVVQAIETDTAQAVTPSQTTNVSVGQVIETDAAQAVAVVSPISVTIGQSSETDTAQSVVVVSPITVVVGQNLETDIAQPVTVGAGLIAINVGQALEADLAQAVTPIAGIATIAVGQVSETDLAQAITISQGTIVAVGQVVETDIAQDVTVFSPVTISLGQALESDLAQPVTVAAGLTWTQDQFRFGADDGNEASYSFIAAQNVSIIQAGNIATIIRIQANTTGNQPTRQMKIQCKQTSEPDSAYLDLPVAV